jgi:endonuclease/exonuclease/phosphatase family metal-dependent hydrolase
MISKAAARWMLAASTTLAVMIAQAQSAYTAPTEGHARLRFATFNASLFTQAPGELAQRLRGKRDDQLKRVAATVQAVRPDVLLINEFDFDSSERPAQDFIFNYLMRGQHGHDGIRYRFSFVAPVNTGVASPYDLNRDGKLEGPNDAWGYGAYPGQYGMLVLSRYPIDRSRLRTFRKFRWQDMPDALLPVHPSGHPWYSDTMLRFLPLPSKSVWDVPIWTRAGTIHFITSHPTPPVFDGTEDRNGRRNHDEIRLLADYVNGDPQTSGYLYDDNGIKGGLPADQPFVIAGDLNADPLDGDSYPGAIDQLLRHPRILADPAPSSDGGVESTHRLGGGNLAHRGNPANDTGVFGDSPGNLRIDYVLPSREFRIVDSGVYWPLSTDPTAPLLDASDHRMVWVDVELPIPPPEPDLRPRVGKNRR